MNMLLENDQRVNLEQPSSHFNAWKPPRLSAYNKLNNMTTGSPSCVADKSFNFAQNLLTTDANNGPSNHYLN
jgi:hypothetical protein